MRSRESQAQEPQEAERGNQSKPGNQIKAVHSPQFNGHLGRVSFPSWWAQAHRALFHQLSDCQSVAKGVYLRSNITWWGAIAFFLNCSQSFTYQSFQKRRTRKNDSLEVGKQRSSFKTAAGTRRTLSPRCLHLRARKAEFWQPLAAPLLVLKFCRLLFVVH